MTTHPGPRGAETIRPTGTAAAEAIARHACPCTCHDDYTKRGLVAPDCAWHSGGGQDIIDALIDAGWTLVPPAGPYRPGGYTPGPPIPHHLAAPMPGEPVITPDQARRIGPAATQAARAQIALLAREAIASTAVSETTPIQQAGDALMAPRWHTNGSGDKQRDLAAIVFESIDRDRLAQVLMDHDAHTSGDGMTWDGPIGETDQTREHVRNAYRAQADAVLAWLRGEGT